MKAKLTSHHLFYLPEEVSESARVEFGQNESKHMVASLRIRVGDVVTATDGKGRIFRITISEVRPGRVYGEVERVDVVEPQRPSVSLYLALLKQRAMELAVEKCSELGISCFIPVVTERSVARLSPVRLERLRRKAIEAMKQSLRAHLPAIFEPMSFAEAYEHSRSHEVIIVAEASGSVSPASLSKNLEAPAKVALWIGPEGGFTPHEIASFKEAGSLFLSLGRQRLRSETAAIAGVALLRLA